MCADTVRTLPAAGALCEVRDHGLSAHIRGMTDINGKQAAAPITAFKDILASALSSDPGNTAVDLDGCRIAPLIQLLDAVTDGTAGAAVLDRLTSEVLGLEVALDRLAAVDENPMQVRPLRVIRSETELGEAAPNSLVCPAWNPADVFQAGGDGTWNEPCETDSYTTAALWEYLTGSHDDIVMDEDREIWVLFDAAVPCTRPPRSPDSPDWLTMVNSRDERFLTHRSLSEARAVIEAECSRPGGTASSLAIRFRPKDDHVYRGFSFFAKGTTPDQLPWTP